MMFLGLVLAIAITLSTGYFAVSLIQREAELRFRILFAIPLGFAINSIIYFAFLYFNLYNFNLLRMVESAVLLVLAILYFNQERPDMSKHKFKPISNGFYLLNLYATLIYLKYFINNPMGSWDGFRIWNIKAEFLAQSTPLWKNVFLLPHFMSHNDYPMFLPASAARLWQYVGGENFLANMTLGLFFTFGLAYLLYQAVSYFKSEKVALVVTSVFMISDIFLVNGAAQCADIPLAMFFLSAIVCLFLYFKKEQTAYITLGVIFAGLSMWVKNEGMMFFLIYLLTVLGYFLYTKKFKIAGFATLSALPFAAFIILYRKLTASPNDLVEGFFLLNTARFALDFNRYVIIIKTFLSMFFMRFTIFLALALLCIKGFRIKEANKTPFILSSIIFGAMVLGYFCVYLFSPHDIDWLVKNSMDRIILQILPIFLFLFSVNLRIGKPDTVL